MAFVRVVANTQALVPSGYISLDLRCCATRDESPAFEHRVRVDDFPCAVRVVIEFRGARVRCGAMVVVRGSVGGAAGSVGVGVGTHQIFQGCHPSSTPLCASRVHRV